MGVASVSAFWAAAWLARLCAGFRKWAKRGPGLAGSFYAASSLPSRKTPTDGELGEIADEMVGMSGWLQARDNAVPKLRVLGSAWYGSVLDELPGQVGRLGLDIVVGAADPVSELVIEEGGRRLGLIDLDKGVRDRVFRILQQARHEQLGIPEITRRLATEVPSGRFRSPRVRARVIARSEIKHAQRVSSMRLYDTIPEVQLVRVFDAVLGDTDPDCEARNGREVDLATADAMITSPVTHPNCTLGLRSDCGI